MPSNECKRSTGRHGYQFNIEHCRGFEHAHHSRSGDHIYSANDNHGTHYDDNDDSEDHHYDRATIRVPRQLPIPLGTAVPAGDWTITFTGYNSDATAKVLALNPFNRLPPDGSTYVEVALSATYGGEGSGRPRTIRANVVGLSGVTYQSASVSGGSGGQSDDIAQAAETFKGGTVQGSIYYIVKTEDTATLVAFFPNVRYTDVSGGTAFFSLH